MGKIVKFGNSLEVIIKKNNKWFEDVWLNTEDIAKLFWRDRTVITRHINKIYKEKEVDNDTYIEKEIVTLKNWKKYRTTKKEYNLDVILSVWYKVNWKKWNEFRKWANQVLGSYLTKGYVVNERVITSKAVDEISWILANVQWMLKKWQLWQTDEFNEILEVIKDYWYSFKMLQDYDDDKLSLKGWETWELKYRMDYDSAIKYVAQLKKELIKKWEATELFGQEKTHQSLWGILWNIFNWFFWIEPYPSLEEKASHLLYFVIKNHPFNDGNKRIWSFLFQVFLKMNNFDKKMNWEKKINDNTLVAIALMIAESDPKQKQTMTKLVTNLLRKR